MAEAMEERAREGVIEARVYCVSRRSVKSDVPEYVLSRRSPGLKNKAPSSLASGERGMSRRAAGIGGTGELPIILL